VAVLVVVHTVKSPIQTNVGTVVCTGGIPQGKVRKVPFVVWTAFPGICRREQVRLGSIVVAAVKGNNWGWGGQGSRWLHGEAIAAEVQDLNRSRAAVYVGN